ncbi:MAG: (2Fe-2S)-binding protein [Clostridiales bacterium]|nr:(2Fe-2S)-binding protein [Clostridiales bacterium]
MKHKIDFILNNEKITHEVEPNKTLLSVLREDFDLTGAKEGCGLGECGACTVLLNGKPVNSCLLLAVEADGQDILTIEGLSSGDKLDDLQISFIENGALQCGYCTPGMVITAKALLDENPHPTEDEVKHAISGNLCRCTGYQKIVKAIMTVAEKDSAQ